MARKSGRSARTSARGPAEHGTVSKNGVIAGIKWSGIRESNPRLDLGKVAYYHYTNPAISEVQTSIPKPATILQRFRNFEPSLRSKRPTRTAAPHPQQRSLSNLPRRILAYGSAGAQAILGTPESSRTLIDFHHARGFHHGRFLLPLRKLVSAIAVDVHPRKLFAVGVVHGHLPVLVLAALVVLHAQRLGRTLLFHFWGTSSAETMAILGIGRKREVMCLVRRYVACGLVNRDSVRRKPCRFGHEKRLNFTGTFADTRA